jgi:hypothetical protein
LGSLVGIFGDFCPDDLAVFVNEENGRRGIAFVVR